MGRLISSFLKLTFHLAIRQVSSWIGPKVWLEKPASFSCDFPPSNPLLSRLPLLYPLFSDTKLLSCSWMSAQSCQHSPSPTTSLPASFRLSASLFLPQSLSLCLTLLSVQRKNDCKWVPWTTGTPINKTVRQRCRKGKKKRGGSQRHTLAEYFITLYHSDTLPPLPGSSIPPSPSWFPLSLILPFLLLSLSSILSPLLFPPNCPLSHSSHSVHGNQCLLLNKIPCPGRQWWYWGMDGTGLVASSLFFLHATSVIEAFWAQWWTLLSQRGPPPSLSHGRLSTSIPFRIYTYIFYLQVWHFLSPVLTCKHVCHVIVVYSTLYISIYFCL